MAGISPAIPVHYEQSSTQQGATHFTMTMADMSVDADDSIRSSDLERVNTRLRSLLARVASREVCASPGFEQRLFGCLVALELFASGRTVNLGTLLKQLLRVGRMLG